MPVTLEDGTKVTVSLFDIEMMILSLLTDDFLMKDEKLAPGYDVFTGEVSEDHPSNQTMEKFTLVTHGKVPRQDFVEWKGSICPWV